MEIWGVQHGKHEELMGMRQDLPKAPHQRLVKRIYKLSPGADVGIEFCQEFLYGQMPEQFKHIFNPSSIPYWSQIVDICLSCRLNVVFLDDFSLNKKCVELVALSKDCQAELQTQNRNTYLMQKAYKAQIEAKYVYLVGRERKIVKNIAARHPDLAIVGLHHERFISQHPNIYIATAKQNVRLCN